jgi:hypothetical protein
MHAASKVRRMGTEATIVIEHLIRHQMSRILCSTGVYRKWNARLFEELYRAYVEPFRQGSVEFWYKGEIGF